MVHSVDPELDLYAHLATMTFADLPERTVASAQAVILDHFGCAIVGLTLPWTSALLDALVAAGELGPGRASIYGGPDVAPGVAALVNGTATHGLDLDDTHLPTMSHPGAVVIPAAVAAAQLVGADGRALVTAVVAGYEAMGRIARATGLGFGEKGFHATGQVGAMGAAVACSRLLDPTGESLAGAVGLAASMGGGIKAFSTGAGMVKRLHAGRAAQAGVFAALLQRAGFTGPPRGIAGKFGFAPTYSTDGPRVEALNDQLGGRYVVDEVYLKPYAACGAVHGAVAAARAMGPIDAAAIRQVTVGTSRRALQQNRIPEPRDILAAQYSTEYSVALALLGGADDPRRYLDAETGRDADVRQVARRIVLEVDDEAERVYPDVNAARVDVLLADGTRLTQRAGVSATSSQGWDVAERKFRRITAGLLTASRQEQLLAAVAALGDGDPVRRCLDAIVIDSLPQRTAA
jgi:2-methylcitrate dehydratase PrpD